MTYTLELTKEERDMLRDFMMSFFSKYCGSEEVSATGESLYNKIDNLDPEEVGAS